MDPEKNSAYFVKQDLVTQMQLKRLESAEYVFFK